MQICPSNHIKNEGLFIIGWQSYSEFKRMTEQRLTFRLELVHRESSVPYFAGRERVTIQTVYSTVLLDPKQKPDLVKSETWVILALLLDYINLYYIVDQVKCG
jgi:hypothetical protein